MLIFHVLRKIISPNMHGCQSSIIAKFQNCKLNGDNTSKFRASAVFLLKVKRLKVTTLKRPPTVIGLYKLYENRTADETV
jgi:hypothetical protein